MGMKPETDGMEAGSLFSMVKDFVAPAKKKAPVEQTISNKELQDLLAKSYEGGLSDYGDYKVDRELSNPISQVYYNEKKRQPIVVHRGSAEGQDWAENARYGLFNDTSGEHFKKAEETQRRAEQRYGTDNLTTIGHSKGATHAEEYGKRGKQIITLNKPVSPYDLVSKRVPENQIDIKTSNDPVSFLRGFQSGNEARVLESKTYNPLAEHSTSVLEGTGFHRKLFCYMRGRGGLADKIDFEDIKWGSFTEQFKRFKQQHPSSHIHDLGSFADMILRNPEDYAKRTIKRARFYKNVLEK
jgi:hypothetical protein